MLRFKKFLTEMPTLASGQTDNRVQTDPQFAEKLSKPKDGDYPSKTSSIASIGPYDVHVKTYTSGLRPTHTAVIHHEGVPIGSMSFGQWDKSIVNSDKITHNMPYLRVQGIPRILSAHTGKKGKVPNLAAKVYSAVAKHFDMPIMSDSSHSLGARNLWRNLANGGRVSAIHSVTGKTIDSYNPEHHEETVYHGTDPHNWVLVHHPD